MTMFRRALAPLTVLLPALALFGALLSTALQPFGVRATSAQAPAGLWVDAAAGNDANDGRAPASALASIQAAARRAAPGTTIHILPGVYRESVTPAEDGTAAQPIVYRAEAGPGSVFVRGSAPASSLPWTRLEANDIGLPAGVDPANLYYADLSGWGLQQPPRFIVQLDESGAIASRLMPAREPDARPDAAWKDTEFWWLANGGASVAGCDPTTDSDPQCDEPWRSFTELTDSATDTAPAGIEPGDLTTLGDLTGATLVAMDAQHAHYVYRRQIVAHDVRAGHIFLDEDCDNDGAPGLGWGSKYYVENAPSLLDQPGEWWFDAGRGRLYLWPPQPGDPGGLKLEISRLDTGFDLSGRSFITLDGLSIELFNKAAYKVADDNPQARAFGLVVQHSALRYANQGLLLYQYLDENSPADAAIDGFTLADSEVAYMDTSGIDSSFWWAHAPALAQFDHAGVRNLLIRNNDLHDLGFNSEARSAVGVRIFFPDRLRFEGNQVHDVAHAGAHFHLSLIDSPREYGFSPQEIKLGGILVADNVFERTCLRASDCGALKFGGGNRPDTHVFRDVLITGNVFRDTKGWSYVSVLRGLPEAGDGNGLYIDYASGIHAYRNIAYNNTGAGFKLGCLWRDGEIVLYNNIAANNGTHGFKFTGQRSCDNHGGSVRTQVANNIFINNGADAIQIESDSPTARFGALSIDHNLYYGNGWNRQIDGQASTEILLFEGGSERQLFHTLAAARSATGWEANGVEGDPAFLGYDLARHDPASGLGPDFHLSTASSNALDRGTTDLPDSLAGLLAGFEISDTRLGAAYDIGRYESQTPLVTATAQGGKQAANPGCLSFTAPLVIAPLLLFLRRSATRLVASRSHTAHSHAGPQAGEQRYMEKE